MKRHLSSPLRRKRFSSGFSLTEVLVVLGIMSIVAAFATYGIPGLKSFAELNTACNQVANLVDLAKETAISKNEMTAVVVITDPTVARHNQILVAYELQPTTDGSPPTSANWKQLTSFKMLPGGAVVDPTSSTFTFNNSTDASPLAGVPATSFPAITFDNQKVSSFKYVVFTAGGSLLSENPAIIRISPGVFPTGSSSVVYTGGTKSGAPLNYYNLTILAATGNVKIDRP